MTRISSTIVRSPPNAAPAFAAATSSNAPTRPARRSMRPSATASAGDTAANVSE